MYDAICLSLSLESSVLITDNRQNDFIPSRPNQTASAYRWIFPSAVASHLRPEDLRISRFGCPSPTLSLPPLSSSSSSSCLRSPTVPILWFESNTRIAIDRRIESSFLSICILPFYGFFLPKFSYSRVEVSCREPPCRVHGIRWPKLIIRA